MEEKKLEASMAAGEFVAPEIAPTPPFSASKTEKLAAFGMYAAAYVYVCWQTYYFGTGWIAAVFTLIYVALTELLHWNTPRPRESWVWLGCMGLILAGILLGRNRVWGFNAPLFLHIFAVWWVLSRKRNPRSPSASTLEASFIRHLKSATTIRAYTNSSQKHKQQELTWVGSCCFQKNHLQISLI